jgi:NAD(P)-dependent dehydrogenase (short-subunit alcohol dehydrogenase family)
MTEKNVWFVTAGRGMGVDIAKAALAAGHAVVATGRNSEKVSSVLGAESSIADYAARTAQTVTAWQSMDGQQGGDPAKLADALVHLAALDEPPLRFPAGADAVATFENRAKLLIEQANANRELSSNLDHDDV